MTLKTMQKRKFGKVSRIGHVWTGGKNVRTVRGVVPKAIFYSEEARELLSNHPQTLKNFLIASRETTKRSTVRVGELEVTNITEELRGSTSTHRYLLKLPGKKYLVKETKRLEVGTNFNPNFDSAHAQAQTLKRAEELVRAKGDFEAFTVAKPIFALNRGSTMYIATQYYAGFTLEEILKSSELTARFPFINHAQPVFDKLVSYLAENQIYDVNHSNILWSPAINKFVLLDLRTREGPQTEVQNLE